MWGPLRHIWRLWSVGRCFAQHDLIYPLTTRGSLPWFLRVARWIIHVSARRNPDILEKSLGARLALALETLGPAFIKLGQALTTRPDAISAPVAADLAKLQDAVVAFDGAYAVAAIEDEFSLPLTALFAQFDETPIASASVAQVHKATTPDGQTVAVKVLRPGIAEVFSRDLETFAWAAGQLHRWVPRARRLRPRAVVRTLQRSVADELDLRLEASHASELADTMARQQGYKVPQVDWQRSGRTVLTLEWVEGIKPASAVQLRAAGHDPAQISRRIVQVFLRQAMDQGFFHADCHQGNLLISADGTINALDFGIMGRLDMASRRTLALILYGFLKRDYRGIAKLHFEAGYIDADQPLEDFASALRAIGEPITGKPLHSISVAKLLTQLLATTERYSMRTQPQLIMLQKTMVMVEGLAYSLNPDLNMWETARPVLEDWAKRNLAPEVQAADAFLEVYDALKAMPSQLERIAKGLENTEIAAEKTAQEARYKVPGIYWLLFGIIAVVAIIT
ncbi:MAG: 2-polyprenylphenol 6-hydroxylase [Pseudomonadota bacterium]